MIKEKMNLQSGRLGLIKHSLMNLQRVIKSRPELIVISIYTGCRAVLAVMFMKIRRKKVMILHHGIRMQYRYGNFFGRIVSQRCNRYLFRNADIIQASSRFLAAQASQAAKRAIPIYVANPGIQIEPDPIESNKLSTIHFHGAVNLLNVGYCRAIKGTIFLIKALAMLNDLDILLDIVGGYDQDDPYFKEIQQLIKEKNLQAKVKFHGALEPHKIKELYQNASIFVLPSLREGYGIVLAEAMVFGLPIVASNTGGIPGLVENGINGFIVEPGNAAEIASSIRKIILDTDARKAFIINNLEKGKHVSRWADYEAALDRELLPIIEKITGITAIN